MAVRSGLVLIDVSSIDLAKDKRLLSLTPSPDLRQVLQQPVCAEQRLCCCHVVTQERHLLHKRICPVYLTVSTCASVVTIVVRRAFLLILSGSAIEDCSTVFGYCFA